MHNVVYDVLLVPHNSSRPLVCVFYDESRKKSLKAMRDYVKKNGFMNGQYTIATVALRERKLTGEVLSMKAYHELFDCITGEVLEAENHE